MSNHNGLGQEPFDHLCRGTANGKQADSVIDNCGEWALRQNRAGLQARLARKLFVSVWQSPAYQQSNQDEKTVLQAADQALLSGLYNTTNETFVPWSPSTNGFFDLITDLSCADVGAMHCLLSISGALLLVQEPNDIIARRAAWHFELALQLTMLDGRTKHHACDSGGEAEQVLVARALLFCMRGNVVGETYAASAAYRIHWNAIAHVAFDCACTLPSQGLARLLREFVKFHGPFHIMSSLPADQWISGEAYASLQSCAPAPSDKDAGQSSEMWHELEKIMNLLARINTLRSRIRHKIAAGERVGFDENLETMQLESELASHADPGDGSQPKLIKGLFYACARVYLLRTTLQPRQHPQLRRCVDCSLGLIEAASNNDTTSASLSMLPLFLTACAAFDMDQRTSVMATYQRLVTQPALTARVARSTMFLKALWRLMDSAQPSSWDWERLASELDRGDF